MFQNCLLLSYVKSEECNGLFADNINSFNQDDHKHVVNLLQTNNSDIANVQSEDEKLISKIVNVNNMYIMSTLNSDQINTQEYMEFHRNRAVDFLQPSRTDSDVSKMETIVQKNLGNENDLTQSDTKGLEDAIDNTTIKVNINKPKHETWSIDQSQYVVSSISIPVSESLKPNLNSELSQDQDQDSEIIAFRAMCENMFEKKSIIDNGGVIRKEVVNDKVLGFKQVNENVMSVNFMGCVSSTSKLNSVYDLTNTTNVNHISKPLTFKRQDYSSSSNASDGSSSELSNKASKKQHVKQIKKTKYSLSQSKLKIHSKSRLNKPSKTTYFVLTSSEDEDDCVLIKNEPPKNQRQNEKEIKPIFTCSPNGQIYEDMVNFINKRKKKGSSYL